MSSKKKKALSFPVNVTEAAEYFSVSRNTVSSAIKQNKIDHISAKGNTKYYELKELAAVLVTPKKKVRTDRDTISSEQKKHIESLYAQFESMAEYSKFEQAELSRQKRMLSAGRLIEGETVIATLGAAISAIKKLTQKVPNIAEQVSRGFTREDAEALDKRLDGEVRALLLDVNGMIEDAENRLHDGGASDTGSVRGS